MNSCSFSSVHDVYDGGIAPSLNNPLASLTASNTSFIGCCRTINVAINGSEGNPSKPVRQQIADDGANSFTWCVWNGSKTTGTGTSYSDGTSNGGSIFMSGMLSGTLSVKFCSFYDCQAHWYGGGIMCYEINSVKVENTSFNACISQDYGGGGGMCAYSITSCVRISGCEFEKCNAFEFGGGLYLSTFQVSGSECIGVESGKGESACVFECSFISCSLTSQFGGGLCCMTVPAQFNMRSIQFISCNAIATGGGLYFYPCQSKVQSFNFYCYFFLFNNCMCSISNAEGHDVFLEDDYNFFSSNNPFHESYTTNTNERRVCYLYNSYQHTEKKDWLKEGMKDRYVGVSGSDSGNVCGMSESAPCKTVGHAVGSSIVQLSSTVTVLGGKHESEGTTISVGEKKITITGRGKTVSVVGTSSLSSSSPTLFSISTGKLEVGHVGIDHNATRSSSPSAFMVSVGSGALSLEDVLIDSSKSGGSGMTKCVFEVALRQLKMIDVEIKNIKMSQPLFSEPSSAGSSSGESVLGNLTIRNVNRTRGDGVVIAKSVKAGETFVVWNTTMEGCSCQGGNGGGIKVELASSTSKARIGTSTSHSGGATKFNKTKCSGYGGGVMLWLADGSFDFAITTESFVGCSATLGGKDVFVNGSKLVSGTITIAKLNFSRNVSIYDELMGCDRNDSGMGIFPLNAFFDALSGAAHVGKGVNGYGGYDSWFCGFGYFPCKTIAFASQNRFSSSKKNIVLDSGFELGEVVSMAGSYEWEVYCGINKTNVNVRVPSGISSSYLINVESASSIKNIAFQIPYSLSSAISLIGLTSSSLTLTDCSVAHISESTSSVGFGYSIVNAQNGNLKMDRFVIGEGLTFNDHSAIEFYEGMTSVICSGCNFSGVVKNEGDGGWMKGTVGGSGTLTVDGCNVNRCSCVCGKGGGIYVGLKGNGKIVVNGMSVIDGNKAENNGGNGGRGGGMMIDALDGSAEADRRRAPFLGLRMENIRFVMNEAFVGRDVFIKCHSIGEQINETLFVLDFEQDALKSNNSMCGSDAIEGVVVDLIPLITFFHGPQVFVSGGERDSRQCGAQNNPCLSIECAVKHIQKGVMNAILVDGEGKMGGECLIGDMEVKLVSRTAATIHLDSRIEVGWDEESIVVFVGECSVEKCLFVMEVGFWSMDGWIVKVENGRTEMRECGFSSSLELEVNGTFMGIVSGELSMEKCTFSWISTTQPLFSFCEGGTVVMTETRIWGVESKSDGMVVIGGDSRVEMKMWNVMNVTMSGVGSIIGGRDGKEEVSLLNCSMRGVRNVNNKGGQMVISECTNVRMESCSFDGDDGKEEDEGNVSKSNWEKNEKYSNTGEVCRWDGSLVDVVKSSVLMKDITISNSPEGGITMSGGNVKIEKGEFLNNNPSIEGYPSARRNVICTGNGELNIVSLKGGDGLERNTSLWMLNEGCSFEGIVSERDSSFFIPVLESVEAKETTDRMKLTFKGSLLIPCNLSFAVVKRKGEEKEIEKYDFDRNGFLSEREVEGSVAKDIISNCGDEIEVSVCVLFGSPNATASTVQFPLKNRSEIAQKEDERIVEKGKEGKSYLLLIVCVVVVVILLVVIIVLVVRWKKVKERKEELEKIVNDNIRKDPKAFEMVTMEMAPEERWRRAGGEVEKMNEENGKKRVYEKSLEHSESSEHLLSESGSTEYILGKDSDKIPEWALEEVDEKEWEEEIQKRLPSPSISSTDTETTFVRGEDLCPTTSSMSNLVDAMACSSPHEKLIVDLRDSLFMLLHGRNEKKEMAIGSLKEREVTGAQILFWVANGALHSFDEMSNPLSSLANLSPHIVLFSEHMVICIALHSDCSSSDDSDSSSISSSTVVTSASDDDDDSLPSSAFEEEDDFKKECLRWKAPELLMNKNMGATKESVAFSIGMMLWECLTLEVPFGEYAAEVAGQKIKDGERPDVSRVCESSVRELVGRCVCEKVGNRPSLDEIKRETFKHFVGGVVVMTMSDAVGVGAEEESRCVREEGSGSTKKERSREEAADRAKDEGTEQQMSQ